MKETWKKINGVDGEYFISTFGKRKTTGGYIWKYA